MRPAALSGWAMKAAWEPSTDSVTASARLAMKRSASGGMALSCADTKYHEGRVFQPATVAFSVRAARLSGRWVTAIVVARSAGRSAQKVRWDSSILMNRSGPPAAPGASYGLGTEVEARSEGGNGSWTLAQLSPSSSANAERKTSPATSLTAGGGGGGGGPPAEAAGAAWEMTAPP